MEPATITSEQVVSVQMQVWKSSQNAYKEPLLGNKISYCYFNCIDGIRITADLSIKIVLFTPTCVLNNS